MKTKIFTLVLALISFSGFAQQIEVLKKDNSIEIELMEMKISMLCS